MTQTVHYGGFVVIDDPWVTPKPCKWRRKIYEFLGYKYSKDVYYPSIEIVDGKESPEQFLKSLRWASGFYATNITVIRVGSEWLAEHLSPKEFADYVAERLKGKCSHENKILARV